MQRAAIARALVHDPALVVADEPTGNLDSETARRVLALLTELNRESGVTLLLATHSPEIAAAADRVVHMRDGRIVRDRRPARGRGAGTTVCRSLGWFILRRLVQEPAADAC